MEKPSIELEKIISIVKNPEEVTNQLRNIIRQASKTKIIEDGKNSQKKIGLKTTNSHRIC